MLLIILILFIVAMTIYFGIDEGFDVGFMTFFVLSVVSILLFTIVAFCSTNVETSRTLYKSEIYSLTVGNSSGFILRSNSQYCYYVKDIDGYYNYMGVDKENARLKEVESSDGFQPYVSNEIIHYHLPYWVSFWSNCHDGKTKLNIYVPKGSVIQQYNPN